MPVHHHNPAAGIGQCWSASGPKRPFGIARTRCVAVEIAAIHKKRSFQARNFPNRGVNLPEGPLIGAVPSRPTSRKLGYLWRVTDY
jgi:hypothetical protein